MANSGTSAAQAAQAVLGLSSNDQGALLEVLEDYFTSPNRYPDNVEELDDSDDEVDEAGLEGAFIVNIICTCILMYYTILWQTIITFNKVCTTLKKQIASLY